MPFKVINRFKDTHDNDTEYEVGEEYPKGDYQPSEERLKALQEVHPKYKRIFIEAVGTDEDKVKAEEQEKEAIKAELESLGVSLHPNTGLEKLREKLAEAKAEKENKE
ncbi:hypothetical protein [Bacillus sp. 1P02SD]|uniref:hypothetical protein n=1 Tax=Bacillus sp. 1P02SD TaxID=3132264 RepID=UPI0039A3F606